MKKHIFIFKCFAAALIGIAGFSSCNGNGGETDEGDIVFQLLDADNNAVSGVQEFIFDTQVSYVIKAENVASISSEMPNGWVVKTDLVNKKCIIEAPAAGYDEAEESGDIVFTLKSAGGKTKQYTLSVAAAEVLLNFQFDKPGDTEEFAYSETKTYNFTASDSFGNIEFSVPAAWSANYNKGDSFFTITSPAEDDDNKVETGNVSVTPLSVRGEKGAAVSFQVKLLGVSLPALVIDTDSGRFKFSTPRNIGFTPANVGKIEVVSKPEGWDVSVDLPNKQILVTPPADMSAETTEYKGKVTLKAFNEDEMEGFTVSYDVDVLLDGISTLEDLTAFGTAYTAYLTSGGEIGSSLSDYMQGDEFVVLDDINIGAATPNFIASEFKNVLNGLGHTLTLAIDSDTEAFGSLFKKLISPGEIKNLTVAGTVRQTNKNASVGVGGVVMECDGGKMTNVTGKINYTYAPVDGFAVPNSTRYGGLAALMQNGSVFTDCKTEGNVDMTGGIMQWVGGMVGEVAQTDNNKFVRCANTGNISMEFPEGRTANFRYIGGIVGIANNKAVEFTDVTNSGDITIDSKATTGEPRCYIGGIVSQSYGTFTNCVNEGDIKSNQTAQSNYVGGLIGHTGAQNTLDLLMENCRNEGDVSFCTHFIGGIGGLLRNGNSIILRNCSNSGNISNPGSTNINTIGGLVGAFLGNVLENCSNSGTISGKVGLAAGGVAARVNHGSVASPAVIKNCTNTGKLDITTTLTAPDGSGRHLPIIAGVVVIGAANENTAATFNLENCTSTGIINAEVTQAGCAQNVWAYTLKVRVADPSSVNDPTVVDTDTQTSQDDRSKITETVNSAQ